MWIIKISTNAIPKQEMYNFELNETPKSMRKTVIIIISALFIAASTKAQRIELTGFSGYMLSGSVKTYTGKANINDNVNFGGAFAYEIQNGILVELMYLRKDTKLNLYDVFDWQSGWEEYDMSVEYYHLGGQKEFSDGRVRPYASFSLGLTRFHIKDSKSDDEYRFSIAPGIGAKAYITDKIGIRLQARLLMPLEISGFGLFYSTSGGGGSSATFNIPVLEGDFTGGIFISL